MRRRIHSSPTSLVLALFALGAMGCAAQAPLTVGADSFTLERPAPLAGPGLEVTRISTREAEVSLWVRFRDVAGTHTARVRWIDPFGRLHLDSGPVVVNPEGGLRAAAGLTSTLPIQGGPAELLPGTWTAEVSIDGRPLLQRRITLERAG